VHIYIYIYIICIGNKLLKEHDLEIEKTFET
jgi:hypothetical protein